MNIEDYIEGKDLNHLIVSEIKLGSELQEQLWADSGNGSFILDELIQNGEVDLNTTYWTAGIDTTISIVGNGKIGSCLVITENGGDYPRAYQTVECDPEFKYKIDLYAKQGTVGGHPSEDTFRIIIQDPDDDFVAVYNSGWLQASNEDWNNRFQLKFTSHPCQRRFRFFLQTQSLNGSADAMCFDRISVQPDRRVPLLGGEAVGFSIDGDGTEREVFSLSAVDAGSSGEHLWYCEEDERLRLYARPADGDSPGHFFSGPVYKYCVEASWWNGFCNRKRIDKSPLVLQRYDELLLNWKLDLWDSATDIRNFTEGLAGTSTITRDTDTFDGLSAYAAKIIIDAGGNAAFYYQTIQTKPNRKHSIFVRYKTGTTGGLRIFVQDIALNVYLNASGEWQAGAANILLPTSETYTTFEIAFDSHPDYSNYHLGAIQTLASSTSWVDRLSFRRHRKPIGYLQLLDANSIPSIYQGVGDYYQGDIRIELGTTKYLNDGWWYDRKGVWLFHNRENLIKVGDADSEWDDLETIFTGVTRKPSWKDKYFKCNVRDFRISDLTKIPRTRFNLSDYPDINPNQANKIAPVLLGYKTNITPIPINDQGSSPYRFKVSETWFDGVNYEMEDVAVNVYKDGVTLTNGVDYSKNNAEGYFTLAVDPENALITCDSKGLEIDFEDGTYSTNVADFIHFILTVLGKVSEERLNIASLLALKAARTQTLATYINTERETLSEVKKLIQSCTFHLLPLLNGDYMTAHFTAEIPDTIDRWNTEDMDDFERLEETDQAFKEVVIRYDQDPSTGNWLEVHDENLCTEAIHKIKNVLILDTALISAVEAESLRDFYLNMIAAPPDKIKAVLPVKSLLYYPTIQAIFSRQYIEEKRNETIDILEDEVYRLLEVTKNAHAATAEIVGVKNVQAAGLASAIHSDSPHEDHSDSVHSDVAHADGHDDDYTDTPHYDGYGDTPHEDHTDETHLDVPYIDAHIDVPHEDSHTDYHEDEHTDEYTDHEDGPYTDEHTDQYNDFYQDVPHEDHNDSIHYDSPYQDHQDDQPHEDTAHEDAYGDVPYVDEHSDATHADSAHVDSHTDLHDDVPHADSYI